MNYDYCIRVWVEEELDYLYPTVYSIDYLNDTLSFPWKGKTYTKSLSYAFQVKDSYELSCLAQKFNWPPWPGRTA